LAQIRRAARTSASEAVLARLLQSCAALKPILSGAVREGAWLSAGPIRPGIRPRYCNGIFAVGNAAGEAHPVVAEGITMALQSAWLLAERLADKRERVHSRSLRNAVGRDYAVAWRRSFAGRIYAASAFAHWAMRTATVNSSIPLIRRFPALLTLGARLSGKASAIMKFKSFLSAIVLLALIGATEGWTAEPPAVAVPLGADGVQRLEIAVDSYSFTPNRLIVKANVPVELVLKSASWLTPHNFVLKSLEAGLDIEQEIPAGATVTVRFIPMRDGEFKFACTKKLLFFASHEERGMVGTLVVGK
jgi:hypothetical protein